MVLALREAEIEAMWLMCIVSPVLTRPILVVHGLPVIDSCEPGSNTLESVA